MLRLLVRRPVFRTWDCLLPPSVSLLYQLQARCLGSVSVWTSDWNRDLHGRYVALPTFWSPVSCTSAVYLPLRQFTAVRTQIEADLDTEDSAGQHTTSETRISENNRKVLKEQLQSLTQAAQQGDVASCCELIGSWQHDSKDKVYALNTALQLLPPNNRKECFDAVVSSGVAPNHWTLYYVLDGFASLGLPREAEELYKQYVDSGLVPLTPPILASVCAVFSRAKNAAVVERYMKEAKEKYDLPIPPQAYKQLAQAWVHQSHLPNAIAVLDTMEAEGHPPNLQVYRTLAYGCGKYGHGDKALQLMSRLKERGVDPDDLMYIAVINACASSLLSKEAAEMHREMIDAGFQPTVRSFNALIKAYAMDGNMEAAEKLLRSMEEQGVTPNVYSYGLLLEGCTKVGDTVIARRLFDEAVSQGHPASVVLYTTLLNAYVRGGDLQGALQTKKDMEDAGLKLDVRTYTSMVRLLGLSGMYKEAHVMFNSMKQMGVDVTFVAVSTYIEAIMQHWNNNPHKIGLLTHAEQQCKHWHHLFPTLFRREEGQDTLLLDVYHFGPWTCQLIIVMALQELLVRKRTGVLEDEVDLVVLTGRGLRSRQRDISPTKEVVEKFLSHVFKPRPGVVNKGVVYVRRQELHELLRDTIKSRRKFTARAFRQCFVTPHVQ